MRDKSEIQSSFCPIKGKNYAGACSHVLRHIAQVFHDINKRRGKRGGGGWGGGVKVTFCICSLHGSWGGSEMSNANVE